MLHSLSRWEEVVAWWEHFSVGDFKGALFGVHGIDVTSEVVADKPGPRKEVEQIFVLAAPQSQVERRIQKQGPRHVPGDLYICAVIGKDLIERAISEDADRNLLLESLFLDSAVRAYAARRKSKAKTVLLIGSYADEGMKRLRFIEGHLFKLGYDPVLVADCPSAPESLEAKMLSFTTISPFVLYEATFASGVINEFKICTDNELIQAVLHEEGRMATAMQSHYALGHTFINFFPYAGGGVANVLQRATEWSETVVCDWEKFHKSAERR